MPRVLHAAPFRLALAAFLLMGAALQPAAFAQGPALPPGTRFVMSHFKSDAGGGDERLFISISPDGLNWQALNGGNPVWQPAGWAPFGNVVRDPAIVHAHGWFWVVFTSGTYGNRASFGLVKSQDLLNWTYVGEVSTAIPGATDPLTWSPTFFKDGDGSVYVFVSISPINGSSFAPKPGLRSYMVRPLNADFTAWSAPALVELPSTNTNELWVWKEGRTYNALYVDFNNNGRYYHTTSPQLLTGWTTPRPLGFDSLEGAFVMKRPEGGYRLYIEPGNVGNFSNYRFWDCTDSFTGWTGPTLLNSSAPMRNGKAIAVPNTTSYAQWQASVLGSVPLADRAPLADPDGDGLPNAGEFTQGSSPLVHGRPLGGHGFDATGRLVFRHTRALWAGPTPPLLEHATSIPDWGPASSAFDLLSTTLMSDGRELLEWAQKVPNPGESNFLRLKATVPE
jgi:hypothetical protein